ncbi:hypothetical protein EV121DRAFT_284118 [Schizophyllum commune]
MAEAAEPKYSFGDGDVVFWLMQVESTPYRIHSFHLQRATGYFDRDIQERNEGDNKPITLEDVKRADFENLLWFFYESAYQWHGLVDDSLKDQWESVLLLADKFKMRQVAIVASHALDCAKALSDIGKILLCIKHVRSKEWAMEELIRVVERGQPLTHEESCQIGPRASTALAAAREHYHMLDTPISAGLRPDRERTFLASAVFADMYLLPQLTQGADSGGPVADTAITLDVKAEDFENLVWFFYQSPYEWMPTIPDASAISTKWESVLNLADMFDMEEVAQVATYALDRCGVLSDMRKIALCVRHALPREWALEAFKNACSRGPAVSVEEAKGMGAEMTALVAQARERFIGGGRESADTSASASRHGTYYIDEGDIIMRRDTTYFDDLIASLDANPGQGSVGAIDANPLPVDDVNAIDFEHLLWFFYESAYNWSSTADPTLTPKWESILRLADKFGMERTAKVACYALGRAGALPDVRKIALCAKHGMGKDWIIEELERIISRPTPLTPGEAAEIGSPIAVAVLAAAREELRNLPDLECTPCYPTLKSCHGGVHTCPTWGHHNTPCPKRDVSYIQGLRPNLQAVVSNSMDPDIFSKGICEILVSCLNSHRRVLADLVTMANLCPRPRWQGDLYFKIEDFVCSVDPYSLGRASKVFAGMLTIPQSHITTEGTTEANPIVIDAKADQFRSFLWFLYDSSHGWSHIANPDSADRWEDILAIADMFSMDEIARVATYALDYNIEQIEDILRQSAVL